MDNSTEPNDDFLFETGAAMESLREILRMPSPTAESVRQPFTVYRYPQPDGPPLQCEKCEGLMVTTRYRVKGGAYVTYIKCENGLLPEPECAFRRRIDDPIPPDMERFARAVDALHPETGDQ